jgi:pilus assembly protein CpaE
VDLKSQVIKVFMSSFGQFAEISNPEALSVVLIAPDEQRRRIMAKFLSGFPVAQIRELSAYPTDPNDLARMLERNVDVVIVDLDSNPEYALETVEQVFALGSATVFVCSAQGNLDMAVRCMRAGAREFLTFPLDLGTLANAFARISVRGSSPQPARRTARKVFVFLGAKGGCGVTTIAANFAVLLAQESRRPTLLIDLGLPLGDAALHLGMVTEYSTYNALQNHNRLDAGFLSTLLARQPSGLSVLAAPTEFAPNEPPLEALDRLLSVARQSFDYVVVDTGSRMDLKDTKFFDESTILYLITQVGITELRNSNRMISQFFGSRGPNLQVVANRYNPHALHLDDRQIEKALTRKIDWKVPDDYAMARRTQNTAAPLAMEDSPIARCIRRMARKACGLPEEDGAKLSSGLLAWARRSFTRGHAGQGSREDEGRASIDGSRSTLDPSHAKS